MDAVDTDLIGESVVTIFAAAVVVVAVAATATAAVAAAAAGSLVYPREFK